MECAMLLKDFQTALAEIGRPERNDRQQIEQQLTELFSGLDPTPQQPSDHARLLALALDLYPEQNPLPLYVWADNRVADRIPAHTLPYEIRFMTFLLPDGHNAYRFSIWETAERNNRINPLLHHQDLSAPFTPDTDLETVLSAPPPSHVLYADLRAVPYRYKPETDTFLMDNFEPDIPAQRRYMTSSFLVDPAPGR